MHIQALLSTQNPNLRNHPELSETIHGHRSLAHGQTHNPGFSRRRKAEQVAGTGRARRSRPHSALGIRAQPTIPQYPIWKCREWIVCYRVHHDELKGRK